MSTSNELSLNFLLLKVTAKGTVAKVMAPAISVVLLAVAYRIFVG